MESVALLDRARRAGLLVLHEGDRLIVRGPRRLADLAAQLLDHKADVIALLHAEADVMVTAEHTPEYSAEKSVLTSDAIDTAVAMVADIFGLGVQVVSTDQPAVCPPEGGWIPSPGRTTDPYAAEAPTSPCPTCSALDWHRAGSGWSCSRCHPDPRAVRVCSTATTSIASEMQIDVREPAISTGLPATAPIVLTPPPTKVARAVPLGSCTVEAWIALDTHERTAIMDAGRARRGERFNAQKTDDIEWAQWSWNP